MNRKDFLSNAVEGGDCDKEMEYIEVSEIENYLNDLENRLNDAMNIMYGLSKDIY